MSLILTRELAVEAVSIVWPTIRQFLENERTGGRPNLHLVILNPGTQDILYEDSFGNDRSTWKYQFDQIARDKARVVQRTGMVLRTLQTDAPWLYEEGDVRYVGAVIENGLVIAASGLQDHFDEMLAWMVLSAIQGLCRDYIATIDDDKAPDFFPRKTMRR